MAVRESDLRAAKRAGANGFLAAGRIDSGQLLAWMLSKGKNLKQTMSLEEAKTTLLSVRAGQIQREAAIHEGTMVPTEQVSNTLFACMHYWVVSIPPIAESLAVTIQPHDHHELSAAIALALQTGQENCLAAALSENAGVPAWATKALRAGMNSPSADDARFAGRVEAFRELVGAATPGIYAAGLKQLRADRAKAAGCTPAPSAPAEAQP